MTTPPPTRPQWLLSFDFDGTLVHKDRKPGFEPELGELLRQLRAQGAAWVINTGRSLSHAMAGLADHLIPLEPDFIIAREHEIHQRTAPGRWADFGGWNRHCEVTHRAFFARHATFLAEIRAFVEKRRLGWWIDDADDPAGVITHGEDGMAEVVAFIDARRATLPDFGYQRNTIYLRFTAAGFDKGSALAELARGLQLPLERVFAAGDNFNDLPMLRSDVAGKLCCPSNSLDEVKHQVLRHGGLITRAPASSGMVEALRHYFG